MSVPYLSQRFHEMIRVMEAAAGLDETPAEILARPDDGYREVLTHAVRRLADMDAQQRCMAPEQATDILWFHLGRESWRILVADRHWTWDLAGCPSSPGSGEAGCGWQPG